MVININRWTPDTCGCTLEYTWDSEEPPETRKHEFFTIVNVCPDHAALATKTHKPDHAQKANTHLNILNQVYKENLDRSLEAISKAKYAHHKRQLQTNHTAVEQHNKNVKEEYDAILSEPHVHDSHIYDIVLEENQRKNLVHSHLLENNQVDIHEAGYHFEGEPDKRMLVPHLVLPEEELTKVHEHFDKTFGKDRVRIRSKPSQR